MKKILRTFFIFLLALASALMAIVGVIFWFALTDLPAIDTLKDYRPPQSTVVYDRKGLIVGRLFEERRTVVTLEKLPKYLPLAFVAAEDGDFFDHRGIDYFGFLRAVVLEIKFRTVGGRRVGGSTITQQCARAMLLTSSQTYVRKIKEIVLAKRIEDALSKEQILSLYLNQIYFGNGAYGIEEAALTYFDRRAQELSLAESAMLASIPKSPNRINPFGDIERIKSRQAYVLDQMLKHNFIDEKSAQKAKTTPIFRSAHEKNYANNAPYFLSALKADLSSELGEEVLNRGGIKVYSSLDLAMQKVAQEALEEGLRNLDKNLGFRGPLARFSQEKNLELARKLEDFKKIFASEKNKIWNLAQLKSENSIKNTKLISPRDNLIVGARVTRVNNKSALVDLGSFSAELPLSGFSWTRKALSQIIKTGDIILVKLHELEKNPWVSLEQEPLINGGLIALDVASGGVLAMVGGYDFHVSSFNRVTQSKRQPGSGIKPLLYAAALDKKIATPLTRITDAPKAFYDALTQDFWRPRNSTNKFLGDITFRHCLRSSINTCSIELLSKLGVASFINLATQVNLASKQSPWPSNLTLALGSGESFPINVANAMRILPHAGLYTPYHMIESYKLTSGEEKRRARLEPQAIISPGAAYIITNILQEVIGERRREQSLDRVLSEVAGKTGTTNDSRSLWFFGYSPTVLALVFVGYDDNRSLGDHAWGINTAFPIWARFMNNIAQSDKLSFDIPGDIEWRDVMLDAESGELTKEVFLAGTAPLNHDDLHHTPQEQPGPARLGISNNRAVFAP